MGFGSGGLLPIGTALVAQQLQDEERKFMEHCMILTEVHQVLDEMVYDVETYEHECELTRLRRELKAAHESIAEYQQRESVLIHERRQAFEYANAVEREGKEILSRLNAHLAVVMDELAKKAKLEQELAHAHEQLKLSAQLSKELANAQREIRDLHRNNSIHKLLKTSSVVPAPNGSSRAIKQVQLMKQDVPSPRSVPSPSPVSPVSNQVEGGAVNILGQCSDKVLMNVFAHVDANSVLAMSLTNFQMMARVHNVFGMPPNSVMTQRTTKPVEETPVPVVNNAPPPQPQQQRQSVVKARSHNSIMQSNDKGRAQLARAEQIVKSLKKDEIKLFHDMSTRVRTLEAHLSHVQTEREDVAARLHSAESVRDFLMDKLKELEDRLSAMIEATNKKEEQSAMDREIIGFLDARIQEYELTVKRLAKQNEDYAAELKRAKDDHAAKITIVQDMVNLLSDEKKSLDSQLKSQRKVLVREVKTLRAQTQQLTDEKDRYFVQLQQLRHALQHLDELA